MRIKFRMGFTLIELMIAVVVLVVAVLGLLGAYFSYFNLNESARDLTTAINHAQCVMEEIRDRNIPAFVAAEDWTSWAQTDLVDGGGSCNSLDGESISVWYPQGQDAVPLEIVVTVCWRAKGGRIIGEDSNLNGSIDGSEDENGNERLDSPAQLVTLLVER